MNTSGLIWNDAGLLCLYLYIVWGGWLATLGGWIVCLIIGFRQRRVQSALACATVGFLPLLCVAGINFLAEHSPQNLTSNAAVLAIAAVFLLIVAAGPAAAMIVLSRRPSRQA